MTGRARAFWVMSRAGLACLVVAGVFLMHSASAGGCAGAAPAHGSMPAHRPAAGVLPVANGTTDVTPSAAEGPHGGDQLCDARPPRALLAGLVAVPPSALLTSAVAPAGRTGTAIPGTRRGPPPRSGSARLVSIGVSRT